MSGVGEYCEFTSNKLRDRIFSGERISAKELEHLVGFLNDDEPDKPITGIKHEFEKTVHSDGVDWHSNTYQCRYCGVEYTETFEINPYAKDYDLITTNKEALELQNIITEIRSKMRKAIPKSEEYYELLKQERDKMRVLIDLLRSNHSS